MNTIISNAKENQAQLIAILLLFFLFLINFLITNETFNKLIGWRLEGLLNFLSSEGKIDASTEERLFYIDVAIYLFSKYPFLGVGLDNFAAYLHYINYPHAVYSHNNHLELLSCLGIIGYLIYYLPQYYLIIIKYIYLTFQISCV